MKVFLEITKSVLIVVLLTLLTQVGGLVYLLYKPLSMRIKKRVRHPLRSWLLRLSVFSGLLILTAWLVIPPLAGAFGRTPLPLGFEKDAPLRPANLLFTVANRHYVEPELKEAIQDISRRFREKYPGAQLVYLDANFPFFDGFPLLPHRSHDDGEKLDITFRYRAESTGKMINRPPVFLGYGYSEKPRPNEYDQPAACAGQGYRQYSLLSRWVRTRPDIAFDSKANRDLLSIIARHPRVGKIFIEPHLKTRLGLGKYSKIRFHGCRSVRHDDHIHLQR